jgi:hypothetical protein
VVQSSSRLWLSLAVVAALPSAHTRAQQGARQPVEWALEQHTLDRWLHGAQDQRFTPLAANRTFLLIDSVRNVGDGRRISVTLGRSASGRDSAIISTDATGRIARLEAGLASGRSSGPRYPGDAERMAVFRRMPNGRLSLAESRLWDIVVTMPPHLRVGARWTDTIERVAEDGPYRQSLRGRRLNRVVGDTTVGGLRLWIVRDSALVTLEEQHPEEERTLDTLVHVTRTVSGIVRGAYLYDAETRLLRSRTDTALLTGEAVLRYPDGRTFRTPARYERRRTWQLHDSAQYVARATALNTEQRNRVGGMVALPASDLERRLAGGDTLLRDSLLRSLQQTRDAEEYNRLFRLFIWQRDASFRRRLDSVRIAIGDSAHLYQVLSDRAYAQRPPGVDDMQAMMLFMEDPGKAWSLNRSRDWLYENLVQSLTTYPRAAMTGRDSLYAACSEAVCRLLGTLRTSAREPRTRDVALVALFSIDPATWGDSVLQRAGPQHPLLRNAAGLAGGVGASWPAASKLPIPAPGSGWRVWLQWMDGRDPAYTRTQLANSRASGLPVDTMPRARFDGSHRTAIRMHMARTGRNLLAEVRRDYDNAPNDTARLVFGTILHGLDALHLTTAQIVDAFESGSSARRALGRLELMRVFADSAKPLDDASAAPVIDRLLEGVLDPARLWRTNAPDLRLPGQPILHASRTRTKVSAANLAPSIRAKWASRVEIVTDTARIDDREAGVIYRVEPVVGFGNFIRVRIEASERLQRSADQAPQAYAAGTTFYLMNRGGEWVIVDWSTWVT